MRSVDGKKNPDVGAIRRVALFKFQIPSTKFQINSNNQIPMTQTKKQQRSVGAIRRVALLKFQIPSTKFQTNSNIQIPMTQTKKTTTNRLLVRIKAPKSKHQIPNKFQYPNSNDPNEETATERRGDPAGRPAYSAKQNAGGRIGLQRKSIN